MITEAKDEQLSARALRRMDNVARRARAVALRRQGASVREIADHLGMTRAAVHATITAALATLSEELREQTAVLRAQEADRLDYLQAKLSPAVARGDVQAIGQALRIMARRARLLGLDAPTSIALEGDVREAERVVINRIMFEQ